MDTDRSTALEDADRSRLIEQQLDLTARPIRAVMLVSALLYLVMAVGDLLGLYGAAPSGWRLAYGGALLAAALAFRRLRTTPARLVAALAYLLALSCGLALSVLRDPDRLAYTLSALVLIPVVTGMLWTRGRLLPLAILAWMLPVLAMLLQLERGAQDWVPYLLYLAAGSGLGEVLRRMRLRVSADVFALRKELLRRASSDVLTGALNRAGWNRQAQELLQQAQREGARMALVFFDLDRFKAINDRYGHTVGDTVLERAAEVIRAGLRQGDPLARFGGEEFVALLPGADAACAERVTERIRATLARGKLPVPVTVSAGIAMLRANDTLDSLLQRADHALLAAKQAGRNRIVLAGAEPAEGNPQPLRLRLVRARRRRAPHSRER